MDLLAIFFLVFFFITCCMGLARASLLAAYGRHYAIYAFLSLGAGSRQLVYQACSRQLRSAVPVEKIAEAQRCAC
jgi:hypothetical protein